MDTEDKHIICSESEVSLTHLWIHLFIWAGRGRFNMMRKLIQDFAKQLFIIFILYCNIL